MPAASRGEKASLKKKKAAANLDRTKVEGNKFLGEQVRGHDRKVPNC